MPKVEEVKVLNIDGQAHAVDAMSDTVKQLVAVFNEWAQDEADARNRFMQVQAAKNDLSRQIIMQIRSEQQATQAAATPDVADAPAPVEAPVPVQTTEPPPAPAAEPVPAPVVDEAETRVEE